MFKVSPRGVSTFFWVSYSITQEHLGFNRGLLRAVELRKSDGVRSLWGRLCSDDADNINVALVAESLVRYLIAPTTNLRHTLNSERP